MMLASIMGIQVHRPQPAIKQENVRNEIRFGNVLYHHDTNVSYHLCDIYDSEWCISDNCYLSYDSQAGTNAYTTVIYCLSTYLMFLTRDTLENERRELRYALAM